MATNKNFVVKNGLEVGGDIVVTGSLTTSGMSLPASDGSSGQYLQTDGNGNLTWSTVVTTVTLSDGSATDPANSGETITFVGGAGISTTVTNNTVTIDRVNEYTDADAIAAVQSAPHLTIDGGTLYVDTDNNYVGIGDTSPAYMLDVGGTTGGGSIAVNGNEVITSLGVFTGSVADSAMSVGGSLIGPLSNLKVQYGTSYNGTPVQGSFFFDSLNQKLKVYTGSAFVDAVPAGTGSSGGTVTDANTTFRKYVYITGSDTNAISGLDVNGETLSYVTDGTENIEVYVNGIKQVEGTNYDYIATTGTSVTFTYNIPTGSSVDIQVYEFLSNDAYYLKSEVYTKTETNTQISTGLSSYLPLVGGTLTGNLNVDGRVSAGATAGQYAQFGRDAGGNAFIDAVGDDTPFRIYTKVTGQTNSAKLTVLANGNVGIGTTNPSKLLDVAGTARIGAGIDYGSTTVLSVAPGVIQFDKSGDPGGVFNVKQAANGSVRAVFNAASAPDIAADIGMLTLRSDSASASDWHSRIISSNFSLNRAVFSGIYNVGGIGKPGIFVHNDELTAWGSLYINTINGSSSSGTSKVYMPDFVHLGTDSADHQTAAGLTIARDTVNTVSAEDETCTAHLNLIGVDARVRLQAGVGGSTLGPYAGWIQASYDNSPQGSGNSGTEPLLLNPIGGSVGIGMTSDVPGFNGAGDQSKLVISQNGRIRFMPNSGWGRGLRVGGNGYGGDSVYCSIANTNENVHIDSAGGVSTGGAVYINWYSGDSSSLRIGNGNAGYGYSIAAGYTTSSDYRYKENILPVNDSLNKIMLLKPVTFNWKEDSKIDIDPSIRVHGFIAHELDEVYPEAVVGEKDAVFENGEVKPQSVDYSKIVPLLTAAVQELIKENINLKARIETLENK